MAFQILRLLFKLALILAVFCFSLPIYVLVSANLISYYRMPLLFELLAYILLLFPFVALISMTIKRCEIPQSFKDIIAWRKLK
jgi:hypothetical protein